MADPIYSLDKKSLYSLAMLDENELSLPRYQRSGGQWDESDKLGFAMSVMLGFPTGHVTMRVEKGKSWLIDGRQRRETILDLLNPYSLSEIVESSVKASWTDESDPKKDPYTDWPHRIYAYAKGWIQTTDSHDFRIAYDEMGNTELKSELKERGMPYSNKNKKEMIEKLAMDDASTGSKLEKKYADKLKPLVDVIEVLSALGDGNPSSGFTKIYKAESNNFKKGWNPEKTEVPFFEPSESTFGYKFLPSRFGECLIKFFNSCSWDPDRCKVDGSNYSFVGWAAMNWPEVDQASLTKLVKTAKWKNGNDPLFEKLSDYQLEFKSNEIGVTRLSCQAHEGMKVFHIINAEGKQLSEVQKLAAWPAWNELIFNSKNPPPSDLAGVVEKLYADQDIPYEKLSVSRWDVAATLTTRLRHNEIWGGVA